MTPDTYVVDRASGEPKETVIGAKEQQIVQDGDQGTRLEQIDEAQRGRSSLSPEAIRKLVELGIEVEAQMGGAPQDIEWAISGGELYLLQSWPITNLPSRQQNLKQCNVFGGLPDRPIISRSKPET